MKKYCILYKGRVQAGFHQTCVQVQGTLSSPTRHCSAIQTVHFANATNVIIRLSPPTQRLKPPKSAENSTARHQRASKNNAGLLNYTLYLVLVPSKNRALFYSNPLYADGIALHQEILGVRWAEFVSLVLRLCLAVKSGMSVAVVVGINCFLPKFSAAFGAYLMLVFTFFSSVVKFVREAQGNHK